MEIILPSMTLAPQGWSGSALTASAACWRRSSSAYTVTSARTVLVRQVKNTATVLKRKASSEVGSKGVSLAKGAGLTCQSGRHSDPLVQVVGGKGNPLARAAARGEAAALAPRLPAARCDLAALQALAALDPLALFERELSCGGASPAPPARVDDMGVPALRCVRCAVCCPAAAATGGAPFAGSAGPAHAR